MRMMGHRPGVFGTVSAISGSTLTVQSKGWGPNAQATTYTIDATNATVSKNGASSSIGNIVAGDTVMVQGTVSGTSVTATSIKDGLPSMPNGGMRGRGIGMMPTPIQGNGQPVVGGSVSAISGSTLTLSTKAGTTYSVDASGATVVKGNATSSLSSVAVGDNVVAQGAVNGSSVTASSVIDQGAPYTAGSGQVPPMHRGLFNVIGGFFQHLFGFF